jgi:hypothetical protein
MVKRLKLDMRPSVAVVGGDQMQNQIALWMIAELVARKRFK